MDYIIGSKYLKKRQRILEGIRDGTLKPLEIEAQVNLECLLCGEHIEETALEVREHFEIDGRPAISRSFIGNDCYQDAKNFHYDGENKTPLN